MDTSKKPTTMTQGQRVDVSKAASSGNKLNVELLWNEGKDMDPDASMMVVHSDGKIDLEKNLLFYNQNVKERVEEDGNEVIHWVDETRPYPFIMDGALASVLGDNRDGEGADDTVKERIEIDLSKLPATAKWLVPFVTIYEAASRKQHFGNLENCAIRISDEKGEMEPLQGDLTEDYSTYTAMIPGYFYKKDAASPWKFFNNPIGINSDATSLGKEPDAVNVAENIVRLAGLKIAETTATTPTT